MITAPRIVRSNQAGTSLVEIVVSLAVMGIISAAIAQSLTSDRKELVLATIAARMTDLRKASDSYIRDNFSTLEAAAASGPVAVSMQTLIAQNYLPSDFRIDNEYQQQFQLYVRRRAPAVLESLVAETGGQAMTRAEGGKIATLLKSTGGFVEVGANQAVGTKGSWQVPLAGFVPTGMPSPSGHAVAYALARKYEGPTGALMRDATGNLADNRMGTDLDMDNHRILNIKDLQVGGQIINNTTVQNLNDLASVNCANGEVLTKIGSTIMCVAPSGMPSGGIAAFLKACPSGWAALPELGGRVLVGAGNGYAVRDSGGEDFHKLTVAEMPAHNHGAGVLSTGDASPGGMFRWGGRSASGSNAAAHANSGGRNEAMTSTEGGGQAFDNRQAYYVVSYCQKN